jgi:hypothetical protein
MINQIILWSMFIVPWLTLFFMKKEDIKRYIPAALFSIVISTIVIDAGVRFGFWVIRETVFPLYEMTPFLFGLYPVATMWILKFTTGNFLIYMVTNAIVDLVFAYFFLEYLFVVRGMVIVQITGFQDWLLTLGRAVIIYIYQKWQEGEPLRLRTFSLNPQQAAAKLLEKDKADENNNNRD